MAFPIAQEPVPLAADADGVVRVGGTRVTLDTVVAAFLEGATAEEIVSQYPSLDLADAYAAISYYLRHRCEVEAYLRERAEQAEAARAEAERRFPPDGLRARLLARRQARGM
ncbi:MAG: DUF433 domain-containing protein [Planctomycetes bacterium]|nr:DUF433 domain-containing protein [Planctomycetota bacterium]